MSDRPLNISALRQLYDACVKAYCWIPRSSGHPLMAKLRAAIEAAETDGFTDVEAIKAVRNMEKIQGFIDTHVAGDE